LARRLVEQRAPVSDRVLLRRRGQFVDEAFGDEDIVRRSDATPERGLNARRLHAHILHMEVRQIIEELDGAFGRVGVETLGERGRQPARNNG
jgi:hypothetical protein